nr:LysM peptidoglycan-binding domain-containing protein [uncultured Emticicia sp.]
MDLRAFLNTHLLVLFFICLKSTNVSALNQTNENPFVPYEIKFADITFQLTDITRYLVQTELKNIQADKGILHQQLDKFNLFLPVVEPILKLKSVPDDFKFLMTYNKYQTSIETSISLENGVYWCLDREKADEVDLIVNDQFDERKHLIAATKAAVICFNRNQVLYRNWASTLFSHIADKKILTLLEVNKKWAENPYILLDSPAYSSILQFLAYKIAIEREFPIYKPGIQKIVYEYPYSKGKTLMRIALDLKVETETLFEYNKWFNSSIVPESDCKVLVIVPAERYSEVRTYAELSTKNGQPLKDLGFPILKRVEKFSKVNSKGGVFYLINDRKGLKAEMCDSPVTMAYKAGISIERFVDFNDMKETDLLSIGHIYYIQEKLGKASVPFHMVKEGETLWDISQMYGVRLANLLYFNRFETIQRLQRGRVIWLQTTRPKNKPIEYIEMPEEMAEVERMVVEEQTNNIEKTYALKDTIKNADVKLILKDNDVEALPSKYEIGKEETKLFSLTEVVTKKELSNEDDLLKLPHNQEIAKGSQQAFELMSKEIVSVKNELPKEIDLNSQSLARLIKEEYFKNISLPKSVDSQIVSEVYAKDVPQNTNLNKQNLDKNNLIADEVGELDVNKNFFEHTVKKGETLFRISLNFNVTVSELWTWNNLTSTIVKEGKVLKIRR